MANFNDTIFSGTFKTYTPEEAEQVDSIGVEAEDFEENSKVLVCDNTGLWIEQNADGSYWCTMGMGDEYGTFDECVKFLRNESWF